MDTWGSGFWDGKREKLCKYPIPLIVPWRHLQLQVCLLIPCPTALASEGSQRTEKHLKKYSTFLPIVKMQIKMIPRFHLIPVRMSNIKNKSDSSGGYNVEQGEYAYTSGEKTNLYSHFENQYGSFSEYREMIFLKTSLFHSRAYT